MHQCGAIGLRECLRQQHVRLRCGRVRLEVVALLEQDRIDLVGRHELQHRDLVLLGRRQLLEVLVGEDDAIAVVGVVGLVDVRELHRLAAFTAHPVVLDPSAVLGVDLMEADVVVLRRGVHLDRHVDQPERDGTLPD